MSPIKATFDTATQTIHVDADSLQLAVAAGAADSITYFTGAMAARIGAVVAEYCQRHDLNAVGLYVTLSPVLVDGQISAADATVTLPNADCQKRLTALRKIAAQCVAGLIPVNVTVIDRSIKRKNALAFTRQTAVILDDHDRSLQKA